MTSKNSLGFDDFSHYKGTLRGDELHYITQAFEMMENNANNLIISLHIKEKLKDFQKVTLFEVHDYFTPPNDAVVCDLCKYQFPENPMSTDLIQHMKENHPIEYLEIDK